MSRRKQSKPRQIKRSVGELDGGEENTADDVSLSGEEGGASDPDDSGEGDSSSPRAFTPLYNEEPRTHAAPPGDADDEGEEEKARTGSPGEEEEDHGDEEDDSRLRWRGPDELELREGADAGVLARRDLAPHTRWGPYPGAVQPEHPEEEHVTAETSRFTLVCEEADCWLGRVPLSSDASQTNCTIYSRGEELFCQLSRQVFAGDGLLARLSPPGAAPPGQGSPPLRLVTPSAQVKKEEEEEEEEGAYPVALRSEIQLLPQQAGMAAILATAVVNKDIFPCKDCGIWYRSERNLQAHLMYYCASRMKDPAPASASPPPPQDKPKDSYPNERLCPFPQCNKSCPSASSLEIHMRTHSGERPFVCLVCLSAFTTKANCERHLKVHTDTLHGVCHGCGFVSATRDLLYSHLVTSHMVCQPGSHSEVYTPGPGLPKLPLSTGLSPGDSGVVLKCQVCGHNSDSPAQLQQHVRTHLEVRVPAERSPTPRQSTPPSAQLLPHPQPPPQDREPPGCVPRPDSSSPGANGGSATLPDRAHRPAPGVLKIKEEPCSDSEADEQQRAAETEGGEEERHMEEEEEDKGAMKEKRRRTDSRDPTTTSSHASPRSPSAAIVKAEPTSPTPGSSPAHLAWSVLPGGTVFLPQNMFSPEAAILPQASEILAKMSEMVHSRLKQGQPVPPNNSAAFYPAGATSAGAAAPSPLHKGATCFECDITFNNINNFYVHKRLYCSSRHQNDPPASTPAPGAPASVPAAGPHGATHSPQSGGTGSRAASASPTDSDQAAGSGVTAEGRRPAEVKMETPGAREGVSSSSDGEGGGAGAGAGGGGRASESSQSPAESGSADDPEEDPSRTFCSACNIHFSRHENYTVHKRFYCASRHDPGNHRGGHAAKASAATSAAFQPQPIRTRKRKKMYEIHMARSQALAQAAATAAAAAAAPSPSTLGLAAKRDASPSQTARSSSPEGDGPIDLSKRPRLREVPRGEVLAGAPAGGSLPALPLTDYHKCTACSISFNSIENYLAHKTYYCPATTLQPHTLEQLHRLKRPASTSPKSRPQERADTHHHQSSETKALPADWVPQLKGTSPSPHPSALPGSEAASPNPTTTLSPGGEAAQGSPPVLCPYCPPTRAVTCDLVEHFRSAHGLVLSLPQLQEAHPGSQGASPGLSPRDGATPPASSTTPPKTGIRIHRNSLNGRARRDTASSSSSSPVVNGSPLSPVAAVSPLTVSPSMAHSLTVSPVPDALREGVAVALLPDKAALALASHPLVAPPGPKASMVSPGQNGNTRFCRLCNIKFSSLSTFIAHKKYYCSSHSAEHVK